MVVLTKGYDHCCNQRSAEEALKKLEEQLKLEE